MASKGATTAIGLGVAAVAGVALGYGIYEVWRALSGSVAGLGVYGGCPPGYVSFNGQCARGAAPTPYPGVRSYYRGLQGYGVPGPSLDSRWSGVGRGRPYDVTPGNLTAPSGSFWGLDDLYGHLGAPVAGDLLQTYVPAPPPVLPRR